MNIEPTGPRIVGRRMETTTFGDRLIESVRQMDELVRKAGIIPDFNPTHWPPRPTRMAIAIRLGITRILLERKA